MNQELPVFVMLARPLAVKPDKVGLFGNNGKEGSLMLTGQSWPAGLMGRRSSDFLPLQTGRCSLLLGKSLSDRERAILYLSRFEVQGVVPGESGHS